MAKKKAANNPGIPEWVLTYGDLMSLLLCFFILLSAFRVSRPFLSRLARQQLQLLKRRLRRHARHYPQLGQYGRHQLHWFDGLASFLLPLCQYGF